jgi:hypothetical protein
MPTQIRNAPTIAEVTRKIAEFEDMYGLSTEVFVTHDSLSANVDEDDAMEWNYLHEQLCALREDALEFAPL